MKNTWVPKLKLKPCVFSNCVGTVRIFNFEPHQKLSIWAPPRTTIFLVGPKAEDKLVSFQTLTQSIPV